MVSRMSSENNVKSGFPFLQILTLIFVVAKLWGVINWSWWLVFLPFWGPLALILSFFLACGLVVLAAAISEALFRK